MGMSVLDVQELKAYCAKCKKIVEGDHDCSGRHIVLADSALVGIVDRLYNLGLEPMMGMFGFTNDANKTYTLKMSLILCKYITFEVLGPLPPGWQYYWNNGKLYSLEFTDWKSCLGSDDAEARLTEVIREFEEFLDEKDVEGIRSLLLIAGW